MIPNINFAEIEAVNPHTYSYDVLRLESALQKEWRKLRENPSLPISQGRILPCLTKFWEKGKITWVSYSNS